MMQYLITSQRIRQEKTLPRTIPTMAPVERLAEDSGAGVSCGSGEDEVEVEPDS